MTKQRKPSARAYGVTIRDGEILMVRAARRDASTSLWWLPGGGIEFGESPEAAVVREFFEETGITIENPRLLDVTNDTYRRHNGDLVHNIRIIYTVDYVSGELRDEVNGTTDLALWMPLDQLGDYEIADYAQHAIGLVTQTK
jgi:ADP-ribose pyrophosphatase YjhB (NUDIX family)